MKGERDWVELSAYLDGELSAAERAEVEKRLASDPAARSAVQTLERMQTLLATTVEDVDFTAAVEARARALQPASRDTGNRFVLPGVAAAVLLVAVIAGLSWFSNGDPPDEPLAAAPEETAVSADAPPPATIAEPDPRPAPATRPDPEPEEVLPAVVFADAPPVDQFYELPEADVPYVLLAVDTTVTPPRAFVRSGRDESVERIAQGDVMPDDAPLAWAGARGLILGSPGEWRRVDAPGESTDSLTGWWQLRTYRNDSHRGTSVQRISEAPDGRFLLHFSDVDIQGQRDGSLIEMSPPPAGDGPNWRGRVTHGSSRIEISGSLDDDFMSIQAERLTPLAHAEHAYRESLRLRAVNVADSLLHELDRLLRREEPLPDDAAALTALMATRSQEEADFLARALVYYEPFDLAAGSAPSPPAEAAGDPDALERFELEMSAAYGLDAPVSLPILELAPEENGDRVGLRLSPSGHLSLWQLRATQEAIQDDIDQADLAALNHRRFAIGVQSFQREYGGYTPAGWWGLYGHMNGPGELELTHPGDEPGTLSYEILLPATDVDAYLEELFGDEALESSQERQRLRGELPLIAENRPFGEPPGRHVLFADGHAEWLPEQDYQQLLREWFR